MSARIMVYNQNQTARIADLGTFVLGERSWVLNGVGSATFQLGYGNANAVAGILRPGNWVAITSTLTPLVWRGRIDELSWGNQATLNVTCNGNEIAMKSSTFNGQTNTFPQAIAGCANVHVKQVDYFADSTYTGNLMDAINDFASQVNGEWMVDHSDGGVIFTSRVGSNKSFEVSLEDAEDIIAYPTFTANFTDVVSHCDVQSSQDGHIVTYIDNDILNFFGGIGRQGFIGNAKGTDADLLQQGKAFVDNALKNAFSFDVSINNRRGMFAKMSLGDTINVHLVYSSWSGTFLMRIMGLAVVDENQPQFRLVVVPADPQRFLQYF